MRKTTLFFLALFPFVVGCGDDGDAGFNPARVGTYCEKNDDCATKLCHLGPGGGYCTAPCEREGDTADCPPDTVCKPIQGGPRRCLLVCGSGGSRCGGDECPRDVCPTGSSCVSISNTSAKGCEPTPRGRK